MYSENYDNESVIILHFEKKDLNVIDIGRLCRSLRISAKTNRVGLNLNELKHLSNSFLNFLKELAKSKQVAIFNVSSSNIALLNITKYNRFVSIFMNKIDFLENKNPLVIRKFSIVK